MVPAYNEELLIGRCLESLIAAGVAAGDIYVANDRSTDGTAAVVERFAGVHLLTSDRQLGKLGGLRRAIEHFELLERYEFLALFDADSHVSSTYFTDVVSRFTEYSDVVLVCGAPSSDRCNWLTAYRALEYAVTLRSYRAGQDRMGVITVAPGCASTYRTRALAQFDWDGDTLVEDMDLTVQVHRKGLGHIAYVPTAVTHTQDPRRLSEYIGQMTRWYSGTWQVMRLHRIPFGGQKIDAEFALLLAEGLFFAGCTLTAPVLGFWWPHLVLRWFALDQAMWLFLALACAIQLRRADILIWFPTFVVARYVNAFVLFQTFWLEVVCRRHRRQWFSVKRYEASVTPTSSLEQSHA